MTFDHNHLIGAAHTLSFPDVSKETKKELTDMFEMGHNASSATHAHEQRLLYEAEVNKQVLLADRAQNPSSNLNDMQLQARVQEACSAIDKIADDLKEKLKEQNEQLLFGVEKFTPRYQNMKGSIPLLTSCIALGGLLEDWLQAEREATYVMTEESPCKQQLQDVGREPSHEERLK